MKKNIKMLVVLLISLILLTGCGETEEDFDNAKNPEKFVKESISKYYKKEFEVIDMKESQDEDGNQIKIMQLQVKDNEDFTFSACSFWEIESPIPARHYTYINNYEDVYKERFLKEYLGTGEYGEFLTEPQNYQYKESCELDRNKVILEISGISEIDNIEEVLKTLEENKETYSLSFEVRYNDKTETININENTKESENIEKLNSLKNS